MLRPPVPVGNRIIMRPDRAMHLVVNTHLDEGTNVSLPFLGHTDVIVDWGDGTKEHIKQPGYHEHIYKQDGTYNIRIRGKLYGYGRIDFDLHPGFKKLVACKSFGQLGLESLQRAFGGLQSFPDHFESNIVEVPAFLPPTVKNLERALWHSPLFNDSNISNWDISNVTDITGLFQGCAQFNQPLNDWNISKCAGLLMLFRLCSNFNQPLDKWDTSNIKTMSYMFQNAESFNQDISGWDVSNLNQAWYMFIGASAFNNGENPGVDNLGIGAWNVSNLGNYEGSVAWAVSNMFEGASSFNCNISSWDVSNVKSMGGLFRNATSFNQDLSSWCVQNVASAPSNFSTNTPAWDKTNRLPVWGTCPGE